MDKNIANAYAEVLDILNYIEPQYKVKIPKDMLDMFKSKCNKDYLKALQEDKTDSLEKNYSEEALSIIAYLNLEYWCETKEEKKYYRDMYLKK